MLGGNGFVGSAVSKEAISQGLEVVSLNRYHIIFDRVYFSVPKQSGYKSQVRSAQNFRILGKGGHLD